MITLTPQECRVLGVLVEKAQTTPAHYPLTLNAVTIACNQKNNRYPVTDYDESTVIDALDGLREKHMVIEVYPAAGRTIKYKHDARQTLQIGTPELVILAELWLRGPQTVGELRGRASRMNPFESIDIVRNLLEHMAAFDEPFIRRLPPAPASRAQQYVQLFCPDAHPIDASVTSHQAAAPTSTQGGSAAAATAELSQRVDSLETEVSQLRGALMKLADSLGATDLVESAGKL